MIAGGADITLDFISRLQVYENLIGQHMPVTLPGWGVLVDALYSPDCPLDSYGQSLLRFLITIIVVWEESGIPTDEVTMRVYHYSGVSRYGIR